MNMRNVAAVRVEATGEDGQVCRGWVCPQACDVLGILWRQLDPLALPQTPVFLLNEAPHLCGAVEAVHQRLLDQWQALAIQIRPEFEKAYGPPGGKWYLGEMRQIPSGKLIHLVLAPGPDKAAVFSERLLWVAAFEGLHQPEVT